MNRHYLALDLGAESGRAILAHLDGGRVQLTELHRFGNTPVQLPTGMYWDTLRLFHEICEGIRAAGKAVDHFDGLAIDTWGVDFGLLDAKRRTTSKPKALSRPSYAGSAGEGFQHSAARRNFPPNGYPVHGYQLAISALRHSAGFAASARDLLRSCYSCRTCSTIS